MNLHICTLDLSVFTDKAYESFLLIKSIISYSYEVKTGVNHDL